MNLIRNLLVEKQLGNENTEGVGTLTLVCSHHQRELEERLTDYQHQHLHSIISTSHLHLAHHLCLEVMLLGGKAKEIKGIAHAPIAIKGVKHGKLMLTAAAATVSWYLQLVYFAFANARWNPGMDRSIVSRGTVRERRM